MENSNDRYKLKKYFNELSTYNEIKKVERLIKEAAYEALANNQWQKMHELVEKLKYWKKLTLEKNIGNDNTYKVWIFCDNCDYKSKTENSFTIKEWFDCDNNINSFWKKCPQCGCRKTLNASLIAGEGNYYIPIIY